MTVSVQQPQFSTGPVTYEPDIWNFAVGAMALLFLIYITVKGELPKYLSLLIYTPPSAPATSSSASPAPTANQGSVGSQLQGIGQGLSMIGGLIQ